MTPAVHQIIIPNPFFEGKNHVYVIATDPVTLIDTGVATSDAFAALETGLNQHGLRVHDIRRVVLTHKHIDHVGNAWRFQQHHNMAEIWIHESECNALRHVDPQGREFLNVIRRKLKDWQAEISMESEALARVMPHWEIEPAEVHELVDGQQLEFDHGTLEVIHTPGHTQGSVCLAYGRHLFTGDHVLPDVSPNIGGGDLEQKELLEKFFRSLARIEALGPAYLALPGHGQPFAHLIERCEELAQHHRERLDKICSVLHDRSLTIYEIAQRLFGPMDSFHTVLGCAEVETHLEWLVKHGRVRSVAEGAQFTCR